MEVVLPFQRRNVQEWSHRDQLTGVLETARRETDQWAARTPAGSGQYNKVVDSRNVVDGSKQQHQLKQVEVFQAQGPRGKLQVIRTSTSTSTSSRRDFSDLHLPLNTLDVSSLKTKASVARSGSIGSRRPPTRPRSITARVDNHISEEQTEEKSKILDKCLSHDNTRQEKIINGTVGDLLEIEVSSPAIKSDKINNKGSKGYQINSHNILKIDNKADNVIRDHIVISRKKSSSTEDLQNTGIDKSNDDKDEKLKRTSKVRRSLQYHTKSSDNKEFPPIRSSIGPLWKSGESSNIKRYEALEGVLRRGMNIAESVNKSMNSPDEEYKGLDTDSLANHLKYESMLKHSENISSEFSKKSVAKSSAQRHSFVTVESLNEVRGRLRHLRSPHLDNDQHSDSNNEKLNDEQDDGIGNEDRETDDKLEVNNKPTRVKSYVYGMETLSNMNSHSEYKSIPGTGSLESRTSNKSSGSSSNRSEEWYNRRKSYGFEQVTCNEIGHDATPIACRDKNRIESSTDSGICRSSETVSSPMWSARTSASNIISKFEEVANSNRLVNTSQAINIKQKSLINKSATSDSSVSQGRKTIVTLGNKPEQINKNKQQETNRYNKMSSTSLVSNAYRNSSHTNQNDFAQQSQPVTVSIPIISESDSSMVVSNSNIDSRRLYFRQLSEGTSLSVETSGSKSLSFNRNNEEKSKLSNDSHNSKRETWNVSNDWHLSAESVNSEMKRHSIAVDESKYVREGLKANGSLHSESVRNAQFDQKFSNISALELAKKFELISSSNSKNALTMRKDQANGINVSFVQNGNILSTMDDDGADATSQIYNNKKHKKVEFCKTEVHFVADSGRVNIVETDEKPPPANLIRRRRRNSSSVVASQVQDSNKNGLPEVRFGDSLYEKKLLGGTENIFVNADEVVEKFVAPSIEPTNVVSNVKQTYSSKIFQGTEEREDSIYTQANATISTKTEEASSTKFKDDVVNNLQDNSDSQISSTELVPKSILKNHRKPQAFLLGENMDIGVLNGNYHLGPTNKASKESESSGAMWKSTVTLRSTSYDKPQSLGTTAPSDSYGSNEQESEIQKLIKSLRPASFRNNTDQTSTLANSLDSSKFSKLENNSLQLNYESASNPSSWSVADRIRFVENMKNISDSKGFSTRINFIEGEPTIVESTPSDTQVNSPVRKPVSHYNLMDRTPMWQSKDNQASKASMNDAQILPVSNKRLIVHVGTEEQQSINSNQETSPSLYRENFENDKLRTTTITIDLTPSPEVSNSTDLKISSRQSQSLQSPQLIMKAYNNSSNRNILTNNIDMDKIPINSFEVSKIIQKKQHSQNNINYNSETDSTINKNINKQNALAYPDRNNESDTNEKNMSSQLARLKELYYSGDISDDSEKADEEVRSYMSCAGDFDEEQDMHDKDDNSVLSGSWSRVSAFRNIQHHFRKFKHSDAVHQNSSEEKQRKGKKNTDDQHQLSVVKTVLPSYDASRLCSVETLVSTKSGCPKITSISLKYEGDNVLENKQTTHSQLTNHPNQKMLNQPYQTKIENGTTEKQDNSFDSYKPHSKMLGKTSIANESPRNSYIGTPSSARLVSHMQNKSTLPQNSHQDLSSTNIEEKFQEIYLNTQKESESQNSYKQKSSENGLFYQAKKNSQDNLKSFEIINEISNGLSKENLFSSRKLNNSDSNKSNSLNRTMELSDFQKFSPNEPSSLEQSSNKLSAFKGLSPSPKLKSKADSNLYTNKQTDIQKKTNVNSQYFGIYNNYLEKNTHIGKNSSLTSDDNSKKSCKTNTKIASHNIQNPKLNHTDISLMKVTGSTCNNFNLNGKKPPSHIYENVERENTYQNLQPEYQETESTILEELTKAADQILQAVNGYTDEESTHASSDDDLGGKFRRGRKFTQMKRSADLTTISEISSRKPPDQSKNKQETKKTNINSRRPNRLAKSKLCPTSSTSSVESYTREVQKPSHARPLLRKEKSSTDEITKRINNSVSNNKSSSRTARYLMRASSREMLLQAHASSSEDVMSGVESESTRKRVTRRTKVQEKSTNSGVSNNLSKKAPIVPTHHHPLTTGIATKVKEGVETTRGKDKLLNSSKKSISTQKKKTAETVHHSSRQQTRLKTAEDLQKRTSRSMSQAKSTPNESISGVKAATAHRRERYDCDHRLVSGGSRSTTTNIVHKRKSSSSQSEAASVAC